MKIGILPLARPTFDIAFAETKLAAVEKQLAGSGHEFFGKFELLLDAETARTAVAELRSSGIDRILLLQITFTDATIALEASRRLDMPLAIWAVPEPRAGGRLRLNAFCGLNLASHALGLARKPFAWLYADAPKATPEEVDRLLCGEISVDRPPARRSERGAAGNAVTKALSGKRIARIGEHPEGFATCSYDAGELNELAGVCVDELELDALFDAARNAGRGRLAETEKLVSDQIDDLDKVDAGQLARSLRLRVALQTLAQEGAYDAFAIRCWPECFTEYGGAVCGPVSMMGEAGIPCACEADVYGALTQLILQEAAGSSVFLTDLVDIDNEDDTGVVWHCGQAPISMHDPKTRPSATVHSNRKMPLLYQFPLKPGPFTFLRISQALGEPKMVLGAGMMLRRPMAFSGTSGIFRFERKAKSAMRDIIDSGMEHHLALAYGEHRPVLRQVAAAMALPVLEI